MTIVATMKHSLVLILSMVSALVICAPAHGEESALPSDGVSTPDAAPAAEKSAVSPDQLRDQAVALFREGDASQALRLLQDARTRYEELLDTDPGNYHLTQKLAMTLFDLGEYETAQRVFERALSLRESHSERDAQAPQAAADGPEETEERPPDDETLLPVAPLRGLEVHPDLLFDPDPTQAAANLRAMVARVIDSGANAVYVHGMTRPNTDGAHAETYFTSSLLPLRADLLTPLAEQLAPHGIAMHVIMPVLSPALPETDRYRSMMVMSMGRNRIVPSTSWRKRLSPFNTNGLALMTQLYTDLATNVPLAGIVFGDDAYLTDTEDLNPAAVEAYQEALDTEMFSLTTLSPADQRVLTELKTERLNQWCEGLMEAVLTNAPHAVFARTLYAPAAHHPPSRKWLAQDYEDALTRYDMVYLLADPEMEGRTWKAEWTEPLVDRITTTPAGIEKTLLRIPAFSRREDRWLGARALSRIVRQAAEAGAIHFVIGPNDVVLNRPAPKTLQRVFQAAR